LSPPPDGGDESGYPTPGWLVFVSHSLESYSQPRTYRYNKLSKLKSIFQLKIKYKNIKDSHIARRDDDNPIVFMRRYRRANEVASPVSAWGCGSWGRSITPHHLVLVVPDLPFVVPLLLLVLLVLLLQLQLLLVLLLLFLLLLLGVLSSTIRGVLHLLLPPQAVLLRKKWDVKKSVISY
jgi:hypothetical protein